MWPEKTREDARLRVSASRALVPLTTRAGLVEDGEILVGGFGERKRKARDSSRERNRLATRLGKFVQSFPA